MLSDNFTYNTREAYGGKGYEVEETRGTTENFIFFTAYVELHL
jgi:hypothetical protein